MAIANDEGIPLTLTKGYTALHGLNLILICLFDTTFYVTNGLVVVLLK